MLNILRFNIVVLIVLTSLTSYAYENESVQNPAYPPIIEVYPNCDYEVIQTYSLREKTHRPAERGEIKQRLLNRIREKADNINADAVIIVQKKIYRFVNKSNLAIFTIKYNAELINLCEEKPYADGQFKRYTAYNKQGDRVTLNKKGNEALSYAFSFNLSDNRSVHLSENSMTKRPEITNHEVSLENGVYGAKLNDSYQSVLKKFGEPNSQISLSQDEVIIGYGRKHWLTFQYGKLIKIQTSSPLYAQATVNRIPFISYFDSNNWKINNNVSYKTTLTEVQRSLLNAKKFDGEHKLVLENQSNQLTLLFNEYKDLSDLSTDHFLSGFVLEKKPSTKSSKAISHRDRHFNVFGEVIDSIEKKQSINDELLLSQLGESLASITLSNRKKIKIYNNNLILTTEDKKIKNISFLDNLFLANVFEKNNLSPWYIGQFKQGQTKGKLRKYFPEDIFELSDKVEIDSNDYQLSLIFDDSKENSLLYEAKLVLY